MVKDVIELPHSVHRNRHCEGGSALLVALIMLLVMSVIGVGAMQSTVLQERMSTNLLDRELAFQAAEAALREAEVGLSNGSYPDPADYPNSNGLFRVNHDDVPDWREDFSAGDVQVYSGSIDGVAKAPEYYIEAIDTFVPAGKETEAGTALSTIAYFRITARGYGGSENTQVVLSSVYRNQ